ncbi:transposase [Desulfosarcina widdelii]|uniref:Transposase n=1 Tax=Desulfosarcina widdelii TaxID=947919 RepID=A0A5K7Z7B4_9BACT|nr:transposase [Desulfosarcina widdelii]
MAEYTRFINDEQWKLLKPLLPKPKTNPKGGQPAIDNRQVLEGILWVLRTGGPWKDLPQRYPPYQTCHRRFQQWVKQGVFRRIAQELVEDLSERGKIDIREAFIDGSFAPAKKGVLLSARQNAAKAPRSWQLQTLLVFLSPLMWKALRPMR